MTTASAAKSAGKYQLWKKRPRFKYCIHLNINIRKNKFIYKKINGSVGWNKHLGEQH